MRQATRQTRQALSAAIAEATSLRAWARTHGISAGSVSNAANGSPCSVANENRIRCALGLEPLASQVIEIDETQTVVRKAGYGKPRQPRIEVGLTPEQLTALRQAADNEGISVPEFMRRRVSSELDGP